jgi:hypothetical protein
MKKVKYFIAPIHVFWYTNDYRRIVYTQDEYEIKFNMQTPYEIKLPNKDTVWLKPIRHESYLTIEEAMTRDRKLWRHLNRKNENH